MYEISFKDSAYRRILAFLSLAFLFLIVFGAGLGLVGGDLPLMVERGRISETGAGMAVGAGIVTFVILAVFMAHHVILFLNAHVANDRRARREQLRSLFDDRTG
jgi:hypothetical protein